jgi:propanol-preferring alcohol dehydrogenase
MQKGDKVVDFQVGDRVGVPWLHSSCGSCEFCMEGWETLCPDQMNTGYTVDGCMSEYVLAVAKYAVRIPTKLSNEQAARKVLFLTKVSRAQLTR